MNVLAVISPGLKILFERVGRPEVINRPDFFRFDATGASPAITLAGRTAYGWRKLSTQDSCAICQSRSCSVRRCRRADAVVRHPVINVEAIRRAEIVAPIDACHRRKASAAPDSLPL